MTEQTVPTPGAHLADQGSTPPAPATGAGRDQEPTRAEEVFAAPPVDIFEDESGFTLIADLPGVSKDRLGVKVDGDNLLIEGEVSVPAPQQMELRYAEMPALSYRES